MHCGAVSLLGWLDAAYRDQFPEGTCRLGHAIGLMPPALGGPRRIPQWASTFARKQAEGSFGGEAHAIREMSDHMTLLRECYAPFAAISPGIAGLEARENLPTHARTRRPLPKSVLSAIFWEFSRPWAMTNRMIATGRKAWGSLRMASANSFRRGALRPLRESLFREDGSGQYFSTCYSNSVVIQSRCACLFLCEFILFRGGQPARLISSVSFSRPFAFMSFDLSPLAQ